MTINSRKHKIPINLSEAEFNPFILPHLPVHNFGRPYKISRYKIFRYILYTGCQWQMLPIEKNQNGKPEIHYSQVFRVYQQWVECGALIKIFENSLLMCHEHDLLDTSIIHGDGATTTAKKGGDGLGFNGHKHMKGEKVVALADRNCNVISPMTVGPGNRHEGSLFRRAFNSLKDICKRVGIVLKKSIDIHSATDLT